jgi:hypothetical protein
MRREHDRNSPPRPMAETPKIGEELKKMEQEYEPLLPVEKKLIAWSLGIGLTLLVVLYFVSKLLPDSHQPL